jgi:hypothetical protein
MPFAKRDIVGLLLSRSDLQRAIRADDELPELVDADLHARLLWDLGLDPEELSRDLGAQPRRFTRSGPVVHGRSLAGRH